MELTEKQRDGLGKTFLDVFKLLFVGLLLTDFIFQQAPVGWKVTVAIATGGSLVIGTILSR